MAVFALLKDFSGRPMPQVFSFDGWEEMHADEKRRVVKGSVHFLQYGDDRPLSELATAFFPDLFPAVAPVTSPEAVNPPGDFLKVWERGD